MKIPTPQKTANGTYKLQLRLNGKSIMVTGATAAECKREALAIKSEHITGRVVQNKCTVTVTQAIDNYIVKRPKLSPSTVRGYRTIQKNVFTPVMEQLLDSVNWQKAIDDDKHSAKTLKNAWGLISSVLSENNLPVPKVRLQAPQSRERAFLQPENIPVFLKAINGTDYELAALLGLHSLRRSEICDMTMKDVDLKKNVLYVRGAAVPDENSKIVHKKENKNNASTRTVPIMMPRLTEILTQLEKEKYSGYLITCHPNTLWKGINSICKKNNLPEVGVHGLRHSAVSLAYHLRWDEKTAMQIFGYSDFQTMRKIYTHLADADKESDIKAMTDFFQ